MEFLNSIWLVLTNDSLWFESNFLFFFSCQKHMGTLNNRAIIWIDSHCNVHGRCVTEDLVSCKVDAMLLTDFIDCRGMRLSDLPFQVQYFLLESRLKTMHSWCPQLIVHMSSPADVHHRVWNREAVTIENALFSTPTVGYMHGEIWLKH